MDEKRTVPRRRVLKAAYIVISDKAPRFECAVRNISDTGALLQVSTTFSVPTTFDLVIDGVSRPCRSVRRTDTTIAIEFI